MAPRALTRIESVYNTRVRLSTRRAIQATLITGVIVGIVGDFFIHPRVDRFIERHGVRGRR